MNLHETDGDIKSSARVEGPEDVSRDVENLGERRDLVFEFIPELCKLSGRPGQLHRWRVFGQSDRLGIHGDRQVL